MVVRHGRLTVLVGLCLVALPALCAAQMDDGLGLEELGLGDLGGMGALGLLRGMGGGTNLGNLGALGLLGGGGLGSLGGLTQMAAPAATAPPTVVVSQPALFALGNFLFVAYNGVVTKYDIATMRKLSSATYPTPVLTPGVAQVGLPGVTAGGGQVPTTLPGVGAAPSLQGSSDGPTLIEDAEGDDKPPLVPGATPATGP